MSCFAFQADETDIENCEDLRLEDSGICFLTCSGLRIHALMTCDIGLLKDAFIKCV